MTKHILKLRSGQTGVHGNDDSPELRRRKHGDYKLGTGGEKESDPVPGFNAEGVEGGRQGVGPGIYLPEGDRVILMKEKGPFGSLDGTIGQHFCDGHAFDALNERHGASSEKPGTRPPNLEAPQVAVKYAECPFNALENLDL
jgi:hypothetical protein